MRRRSVIFSAAAFTVLRVRGTQAEMQVGNKTLEDEMSVAYSIGDIVGGSFDPLGTITFSGDGTGTLDVTASGDGAAKLRAAWEDVSGRDVLRVRRTKRERTDEGTVTKFIGVRVERGSEGYPQAVVDFLSNEHGLLARPVN